jgi:putative holliday junction resolvase
VRVLAVDPGDKCIGLAVSDPSGTISRPLTVIKHQARVKDAQQIVNIAEENDSELIVVGWALDSKGEVGYRARKSKRLADAVQALTDIPVKMWDESGTTKAAIQSRIDMGVSRKKRRGHLDELAASILLQDFLINNEGLLRKED